MFPSKNELTICFAHVAYAMQDRFALLGVQIVQIGRAAGAGCERTRSNTAWHRGRRVDVDRCAFRGISQG